MTSELHQLDRPSIAGTAPSPPPLAAPRAVRSIVAIVDGTAVVARRATTAAGHRQLRAELDRLRAAAHPNVVQVVAALPPPNNGYATRWAGGTTLATAPLTPGQAVAVLAQAAAVLADLHARDIVHGRLTAARIVLGQGGRAIIAGLGDGLRPDGSPAAPADDVCRLGELLAEVGARAPDGEAIPTIRFALPRRAREGVAVRAVLLLADQACHEEPRRRPTMAQLAGSLATLIDGGGASPRIPRQTMAARQPSWLAGRAGARTEPVAPAGSAPGGAVPPTDAPRPAPFSARWEVAVAAVLAVTAAVAQHWCWRWFQSRSGGAVVPWFAAQPATAVAAATVQAVLATTCTVLLVLVGRQRLTGRRPGRFGGLRPRVGPP